MEEKIMDFKPETKKEMQEVPYYDDVSSSDGWEGHSTSKTLESLKSEVVMALSKLGGTTASFQRGSFEAGGQKREGFRIEFFLEKKGKQVPSRVDIAALPVKETYRLQRSLATRTEKSLKMALFMVRNAFKGTWFLQQLSPGFAPLIPFMIGKDGKTMSEMWIESGINTNLLLPKSGHFENIEDAEFVD